MSSDQDDRSEFQRGFDSAVELMRMEKEGFEATKARWARERHERFVNCPHQAKTWRSDALPRCDDCGAVLVDGEWTEVAV